MLQFTTLLLRQPPVQKQTWSNVNSALDGQRGQYKNILALMDLLLTLPASSAEAERGFSQLKNVKTKLRTRLTAERVTDLLTVQLNAPSIKDFDPTEAIQLWNNPGRQRSRRPNTGYVATRVTSHSDSESDSDSEEDAAFVDMDTFA